MITASAADHAQVAGDPAVTVTAEDMQSNVPADRGNDGDRDDLECIAEDEVVIGPVCVEVDDVISDILST